MNTDARQPMLFADLPIPSVLPEAPRAPLRRRAAPAGARRPAVQLVLDFWWREFGAAHTGAPLDAEDTPWDFPQHHRVVAGHEPPPKTTGFSSVWDLAAAPRALPRWRSPGSGDVPQAPTLRVEREAGRVLVVRLRPEETEEWAERERIRRAKQRPPRPAKAAKTRGKKVRAWDGEVVEE